jgi:hypothetical protein
MIKYHNQFKGSPIFNPAYSIVSNPLACRSELVGNVRLKELLKPEETGIDCLEII